MCDQCQPAAWGRRRFLGGLAAASLMAAGGPLARAAEAALAAAQPSPQAAMARLMAGNARFRRGAGRRPVGAGERRRLAGGQSPFAVVFICADSRVAPEIILDQGLGDIFVVRNAGAAPDAQSIGSIEYAVAELGAPLLLVIGHSGCGAVKAAVAAIEGGARPGGHIRDVVAALTPAVGAALRAMPASWPAQMRLEGAIAAAARDSAGRIMAQSAVVSGAARQGRLLVAAAYYDIASGRVLPLEG
ncbi:carbonic anhydrase [Camelimonas abortus]|uniref:Carbonic anhydrase n=1 Tax=Camelimonas abortus TaxID=1017184 RepID=A0ABV7LG07_9HYPH